MYNNNTAKLVHDYTLWESMSLNAECHVFGRQTGWIFKRIHLLCADKSKYLTSLMCVGGGRGRGKNSFNLGKSPQVTDLHRLQFVCFMS